MIQKVYYSVVVVTTESQYMGFWIGGPLTKEDLMIQDDLGWLETKLNDSKWLRMTQNSYGNNMNDSIWLRMTWGKIKWLKVT